MNKTFKRKSLSILLSLALVLSLFSGLTFAAGAEETALTITGGDTIKTDGTYVVDGSTQGVITVAAGLRKVILQGTGTEQADGIYGISFSLGLDVGLRLENLYISYPYNNLPIFDFVGMDNMLDFTGTNLLENNGIQNGAILHVPPESALDIGTNTTNSDILYIYKSSGGTAIGGNERETSGTINFNGGTLLIKGSRVGATVGSGDYATGVNEDITINGGNINITTISQGAGIGGGRGNQGAGNVYLKGGNLAMTTDSGGVAIGNGGGVMGSGKLYITGGSLSLFITSNSFDTPATIINSEIYDINGDPNPVPFVYTPSSLTADIAVRVAGLGFYSGIVNQWTYLRGQSGTKASWSPTGNSSIYLWVPADTQSVDITEGSGPMVPTPIHDVIFDYDFSQVDLRLDQYAPNRHAFVTDPTSFYALGKGTYTAEVEADNAELTGAEPNYGLTDIKPGATVHATTTSGVTVSFEATDASVYVDDTRTWSAEVNSGGSLTFLVVPNAGYKVVEVTADTEVLLPNADGSYTLDNITADVTVNATLELDGNAWSANANTEWYNVTGTQFTLETPEQLAGLAQIVNSGMDNFYGKTIFLAENIDLNNFEWSPIGGASEVRLSASREELLLEAYLASGAYTVPGIDVDEDEYAAEQTDGGGYRDVPQGNYFSGTFDGQGNAITGLSITRIVSKYGGYGLFGYVNGGLLKDFTISDAGAAPTGIRTGASATLVGAAVGYTTGSVYNVQSNTRISIGGASTAETGGVVGAVDSGTGAAAYIQFCGNDAALNGGSRLGGVVGAAYCARDGGVLIDQCYNTGAITADVGTGRSYVGGVVGYDEGYIQNSYNTGNVASTVEDQHYYVGGIAGILTGAETPVASLSDSYNTGVITTVYAAIPAQPLYAYADDSSSVTVSNCVYLDSMTQDPLGATVSNVQAVSAAVMGSTTALPGGLSGAYFTPASPSPTLNWRSGTVGIVGPIYVDPNATGTDPDGTITDPYNNLNDALSAQSGYRSTIYVVAPLTAAKFPGTIDMTVDNARIARGNGNNGDMFTLVAEDSLTFSGGVIEGQAAGPANQVTGSLISVNGGSFALENGATLRAGNNYTSSAAATTKGGALYVTGNPETVGDVTLNGGNIIGSRSDNGGGIYVDTRAVVTAIGGNIDDNYGKYGGGVYVMNGGSFTSETQNVILDGNIASSGGGIYVAGGDVTFTNGTISNGTAYNGGGAYLDGGTFVMSNGRIIANGVQTPDGGGVYVSAGTFTLNGGDINGNRATTNGGGVFLTGIGAFNMNGGAIFGNTVISATGNGGGGVCVSEGTTFTMTGGSIHDNAAASNGNGVYDAGTFTVSPATGAAFSIADIIYLANGRLVNIGASIANITGVLNVVASPPAVGNAIAQSAPGYTLSTADARKIMYNSGIGGWYTLLSPTGATIILGRESGIFLDGVNGDDDNEGTSWNNPVQTLSVALDKAGIVNTVYVVNTVTVDSVAVDDSAASGRQITIARSVSNNNPLFNVTGGALTLSYVTVDGNTANNFVNDSSLVNVSGGSFTLSGATLQNNTGTNGGAIYIGESGSVIITGGKITDNTATLGNGIYVAASNTLTLSPSGTGAITFGEDDAIYLPYNSGATTPQVSFNIGEDLDPGVASDVPLAFQNPMSDETVAIALTETMAENSYEKLVSGEMVFYPDDIYIKIEVTL